MHGPRQEETTGVACSMGEGGEDGTERSVLDTLLGNKQAEAIVQSLNWEAGQIPKCLTPLVD